MRIIELRLTNSTRKKIARYDETKISELRQNPGIVRNRLKIQSAVKNAQGFLAIMEREGSFSRFLWQFVDGQPIQNSWCSLDEIPAETAVSRTLSKALKSYGFSFVGPTIVYAFMQNQITQSTLDQALGDSLPSCDSLHPDHVIVAPADLAYPKVIASFQMSL